MRSRFTSVLGLGFRSFGMVIQGSGLNFRVDASCFHRSGFVCGHPWQGCTRWENLGKLCSWTAPKVAVGQPQNVLHVVMSN